MISSIFDENKGTEFLIENNKIDYPSDQNNMEDQPDYIKYRLKELEKKEKEKRERLEHLKTLSIEERLALIEEYVYNINQRLGILDLMTPLK
jgi:chaperonin cofactor prefoldin